VVNVSEEYEIMLHTCAANGEHHLCFMLLKCSFQLDVYFVRSMTIHHVRQMILASRKETRWKSLLAPSRCLPALKMLLF